MPGFIIRVALNILGLWLATAIVPGMEIEGAGAFLAAGLLLGRSPPRGAAHRFRCRRHHYRPRHQQGAHHHQNYRSQEPR